MVAARAENSGRPPWDELSPAVREAVRRLLNDAVPDELIGHAVVAVRRQVERYPRKSRRRIVFWIRPAMAASIVFIAISACFGLNRAYDGRSGRSPVLPTTCEEVAAAFSDNSATVWAYSKAARQSPEALEALLDYRARRSITVGSPLLSVSPSVSVSTGAIP